MFLGVSFCPPSSGNSVSEWHFCWCAFCLLTRSPSLAQYFSFSLRLSLFRCSMSLVLGAPSHSTGAAHLPHFPESLCLPPTDILAEDERRVEAAAAALREHADRLHMSATVVTLSGDPRTVVADFVLKKGADLLVVGSRGLSGATQALLGSVSSYLISHASCPVVVYRAIAEVA